MALIKLSFSWRSLIAGKEVVRASGKGMGQTALMGLCPLLKPSSPMESKSKHTHSAAFYNLYVFFGGGGGNNN